MRSENLTPAAFRFCVHEKNTSLPECRRGLSHSGAICGVFSFVWPEAEARNGAKTRAVRANQCAYRLIVSSVGILGAVSCGGVNDEGLFGGPFRRGEPEMDAGAAPSTGDAGTQAPRPDAGPAPQGCEPGTARCESGQVLRCNSAGTQYTSEQSCSGRQTCQESSVGASCQAWVCTAGVTECVGGERIECSDDGLNILTRTNCDDLGKFCVDGSCKDQLCEPNSEFCRGGNVERCDADGRGSSVVQLCDRESFCDPAGPRCVEQVCDPNETSCRSNRIVTCNAEGSGFLPGGVECTTTQTCLFSLCVDHECTAGDRRCRGDAIQRCRAGFWGFPSRCPDGEFCDETLVECQPRVCTPNEPVCDNNVATTCNEDGSGFVADRTPCSVKQTCVAGVCEDHVCDPGTSRCDGSSVVTCAENGLSEGVTQVCKPTEYCDEKSASCKPQICVPNAATCDQQVATQCNSDGSGFVPGGKDCTLAGQVCEGGVCIPPNPL